MLPLGLHQERGEGWTFPSGAERCLHDCINFGDSLARGNKLMEHLSWRAYQIAVRIEGFAFMALALAFIGGGP